MNLFHEAGPRQVYSSCWADVALTEGWLSRERTRALFDELRETPGMAQAEMRLAGQAVLQPRLSIEYGASYRYSGAKHTSAPWTATLLWLAASATSETGVRFNQALVQMYRDGNDSIGWHADDEPELGSDPTIVSVSLGGPRRMLLRPKVGGKSTPVDLTDGSLLVMRGRTQSVAMHSIPKVARAAPRISVTLRHVIDH